MVNIQMFFWNIFIDHDMIHVITNLSLNCFHWRNIDLRLMLYLGIGKAIMTVSVIRCWNEK